MTLCDKNCGKCALDGNKENLPLNYIFEKIAEKLGRLDKVAVIEIVESVCPKLLVCFECGEYGLEHELNCELVDVVRNEVLIT